MIPEMEQMFMTQTFSSLYEYIESMKERLGMEHHTDKSFETTKALVTRYRKYIGQMRDAAMECKTWEDLVRLIENRIGSADDTPADRIDMAFNMMRDEYLISAYNYCMQQIQEVDDGE